MKSHSNRPIAHALKAMIATLFIVFSVGVHAQVITMASTTSTEQSGLFAHLLPEFKKASGLDVKVVALGTGQALDMARRGDADVLFVHDQAAEELFVSDGWGLKRYSVMYNDFILIGPKEDPAGTRGKDIVAALQRLAAGNAGFISRGDKSGTDRRGRTQGRGLQGVRMWHGPGIEYRSVERCLCAGRPCDVAQFQESR